MAKTTVRTKTNRAAVTALLTSADGAVVPHLQRKLGPRIVRVTRSEAPQGESGRLRNDITHDVTGIGTRRVRLRVGNTNALFVRTRSPRSYSTMVQKGTAGNGAGYIYPRRARVLRFRAGGRILFRRRVRGQKANPFMERALRRAMAED